MKIQLLAVVALIAFISVGCSNIKQADKLYNNYNYASAAPKYEKSLAKKTNDLATLVKLANCYYKMNEPAKAKKWFAKADTLNNIQPADFYLNYGQVLRNLSKYNQAKSLFEKYKALHPDDKNIDTYIESCDKIKTWTANENQNTVKPVSGLNSTASDFSPVPYGNGFVISSDRRLDFKYDHMYKWNGSHFLNLIYIPINKEGDFMEPENFSSMLNHVFHDGTPSFKTEDNTIYFTRVSAGKVGKEEVNRLKIYSSTKKGTSWTTPQPFHLNSNDYSVGHPAFSADGTVLYFSSDMEGGQGGMDLYKIIKSEGGWSKPMNLGSLINTAADEVFPSIDADTIYFSSNGHVGYGGLDIYKTTTELLDVTNLYAPINSSSDDFGINSNSSKKYFSSNRPGGLGADDIYEIKPNLPKIIEDTVITEVEELVKDTVEVVISPKTIKDTTMAETKVIEETEQVTENNISEADILKTPIDLTVYYETGQFIARVKYLRELNLLVEQFKANKNLKAVIEGHSDSRFTAVYNLQLSIYRANSVYNFMVERGVSKSQLTKAYFGETKLVNNCYDNNSCTDEEHALNRRTVVKILK